MWNPLLDLITNFHVAPVLQELLHHRDLGYVALTSHFAFESMSV